MLLRLARFHDIDISKMGFAGGGSDQKQEGTTDFIEGKDWSPSYLNLRCFVFFSRFCNRSCSIRTRSPASGINIGPRLLQ
jgi:hypothetical protein